MINKLMTTSPTDDRHHMSFDFYELSILIIIKFPWTSIMSIGKLSNFMSKKHEKGVELLNEVFIALYNLWKLKICLEHI